MLWTVKKTPLIKKKTIVSFQMKSLILIAALAALAVCHAASLPDEADLFEQYVDVYPEGATSRLSRAVLHE